MATTPAFASYAVLGAVAVSSSADTGFGSSQPSHAVQLVPALSNGQKIDEIDFNGSGTTLAGIVVVWAYNGTTYYPVYFQSIAAVTVSTTTPPPTYSWTPSNLVLPGSANSATSWSLYVSTTVASQLVDVVAYGGSY